MDICICKESALELWRGLRLDGRSVRIHSDQPDRAPMDFSWQAAQTPRRLPAFQVPSSAWLSETLLSETSCLSGPIDLYACSRGRRTHNMSSVSHLQPSDMKAKEVVALSEHVYVTNPARTLYDMRPHLTRCEFLRLLGEFCGGYAIDVGSARGFKAVPPLLQAKDIARICRAHPDTACTRQVARDLAFALDGCASPAETSMALLLCLPFRDGGYGLPLPRMNSLITPYEQVKPLMDRNYYVGDAVWPEQRLVLEYDSRAEHSQGASIAHDNVRKMALEAMGYHVVSVTNIMLADKRLFEMVARDAAKRLGRRIEPTRRGRNWNSLHAQARITLIDSPSQWWRLTAAHRAC